LGEKVSLREWNKFRAGLDISSFLFLFSFFFSSIFLYRERERERERERFFFNFFLKKYIEDTTGSHSIFTEFGGNEVMFHVSTLLPFRDFDKQQVKEGSKKFKLFSINTPRILPF